MGITSHMKALGAPLKNQNWSWGGVHSTGSVVLMVWAHEVEDKRWVRIYHAKDQDISHGKPERAKHIALIREGAKAYAVMCQQDITAAPAERMKAFDKHTVFELTELREDEVGNVWAYMANRIPVSQLMFGK